MKKIILALSLMLSGYAYSCDQPSASDSDFPESLSTASGTTGIAEAWYDGGSGRYRHGVLGDAIEPTVLRVRDQSNCVLSEELDYDHVFEDIETRLANIDDQPGMEVVTIRSNKNKGAQIAVYALTEDKGLHLLTATPYIGTSNRWLAPVGIADFDKNGSMDIAFVDRPHLAKVLRVWSFKDGELTETASRAGYSNHKIGEDFISGGIRDCGDNITMITADAYWQSVVETTLIDGLLISSELGPFENTESLTKALTCG